MQQKKYKKAKKVLLDISPYIEGMTIDDLAEGIGIHPRSASTLKKGTIKGDWKTLINCSRFFNVPIDKLLVIEEEK